MNLTNKNDLIHHANLIRLRILHFAHGVYPEAANTPDAIPQNRFFMPEVNGPEECFISDSKDRFPLIAGNVYFIPAYHSARVNLSPELSFLSIQFRLELKECLDIFSHTDSIQMFENPSFLKRGLDAFYEKDVNLASFRLRSLIMDFCNTVMPNIDPKEMDLATRFACYQKEIDYLSRNIQADMTVEKLAGLRHMRRETFSKHFMIDTGITPKQFLSRLLFNRASDMLLQTDLEAKEIAVLLKFSSEYYFSIFFRRQCGLSPNKFRRQYR